MLKLAISPCPNDTFAFYGLLHQKTSWSQPLDIQYADIEELNRFCFDETIDICKVSFHTYVLLKDHYTLLDSGSALGFGCGPLLVAKSELPIDTNLKIAIPGEFTTAALLLKLRLKGKGNFVCMRFDQIMPAVANGQVDAGLIIHESRFTYQDLGLISLIDLGQWWESTSGHPIPLGGIIAHNRLDPALIRQFNQALTESIDYAWANPQEVVPYMQQHAQEMEPDVMHAHVELYVNQFTRNLGEEGHAAIHYLTSQVDQLPR